MDFKDLKVLVLGAGASGKSAARFLRKRGAIVGIYDDKKCDGIRDAIYVVSEEQVDAEDFDFCVISPGVSINHVIAQKFEGRIISELALGFTAPHKKVVAVTGTNGKTTVTKRLGNAVGKRGLVCGNIGIPVTSVSDEIKNKIAVAEVSSFMMETDLGFNPDISIVLNITQDHLERHGTMEEYIRCKGKLSNARKVILNFDCPNCRMLNDGRAFYYSTQSPVRGIYLDGNNIVLNINRRPKKIFALHEFGEDQPHQISNILAVILASILLDVPRSRILMACKGGQEREHRIQHVGEVGNVAFVNDSKATNVAACLAACACFEAPINLLVGGVVKGQDFSGFFTKLPQNVEHVFLFGEGADEIFVAAEKSGYRGATKHRGMADAVLAAHKHGFGPRVVLLSPACSSFDEFTNYAERGEVFTAIVRELADAEV